MFRSLQKTFTWPPGLSLAGLLSSFLIVITVIDRDLVNSIRFKHPSGKILGLISLVGEIALLLLFRLVQEVLPGRPEGLGKGESADNQYPTLMPLWGTNTIVNLGKLYY